MNRLGLLHRNPVFRRFWAARTVSFLGDTIATSALVLYVYDRHGTGAAVGLLLLAQTLPRLLAPFAGTLADRVEQRRFMLGCELGQAALVGSVALLSPSFPVLLGLVAGASLLATAFGPAGRAALPLFVPDADLGRANALLGSGLNLSLALGPALGGLLVAGVGLRGALAIDVVSFLLSALLLRGLPALPPVVVEAGTPGFLGATRTGWSFLMHHATARAVALGLFLVVVFGAVDNIALVFLTRDELGTGAAGYGLVASAFGVGMVLAPLALLRRWGGSVESARTVLLVGIAFSGVGALLTGLAPFVAFAAVVQGVAGAGNGLENVANDTLIQRTVPQALLGRVFGIVYAGAFVGSTVAYAAGGLLMELTSARLVFVIAGVGVLGALVFVWLSLPRGSPTTERRLSALP